MQGSEVRRIRFFSVLVFCLLAVGLLTVGLVNYLDYEGHYRAQVGKQLETAARLKVNQLVQFRRDRLSDAAFFQENRAFFSLVERLFSQPENAANAGSLGEWLAGFQRMSQYDLIALADAGKTVRMSVADTAEPIAQALYQAMDEVLRNPRVLIVDFFRDEATGRVHLATLVPVFSGEDRSHPIGILALRIDPGTYLYPFLAQWPAPSESAETLLVRREEGEAVFLNELRLDPGAPLNRRIADRSEAFRPLRERLWLTLLMSSVLLFAVGAAVLLFQRRQNTRHHEERAKASEALAESERRYRTLFEALTEGVALHKIVRDGEGKAVDYRFLSVNPAFFTHIGRPPAALEGAAATEYYGTETAPYLEIYERVVRTGEPHVFETYFPPLERHFRVSAVSPKPGQFATIFEDISDRLRREKELQERNEELARITYTVSHDLRSPLVTVRTFLGYLEEDIALGNEARWRQDIEHMRTASEKMALLLDELLAYSRIGRAVEPMTDAPLAAVVAEALALTAGRIASRGARIDLPDESIVLRGERRRLVEIYQNLIDNAVKFMGDQPEPLVRVGVERGDPPVLFVADNGIGFDPRHQGKLFGMFEKLDPGTEGAGIGLALVKRIVETHGGRIWAESGGIGRGAVFRFTLPGTRIEKSREEGGP
jgi:signal transduction histidine kinase